MIRINFVTFLSISFVKIPRYLLIAIFLFGGKNAFSQDSICAINIGYSIILKSNVLNEDRTILIYLPDNYKENKKSFPVLYLLDAETNFKHTIGVVDILSRSSLIPEMIVIGIQNTDRMRDLTPTHDRKFHIGGGGDNFLKFLSEELIPFIDKNYKTKPFRILEGHSMGGLFTMYTFISDKSLFDAYIVISPSMYWDDQIMLSKIEDFLKTNPSLQKQLYITLANEPGFMLVKETIDIFKKEAPTELRWEFKKDTTETHEIASLRSTYEGLRYIYSNSSLAKTPK
jgi:predicted alpha/beta superfamily hydrolase